MASTLRKLESFNPFISGRNETPLRIWTRDYREQIQLAVRGGLELGASEFQVGRSRIWTRDNWEQIQLGVRAGLELGASEFQARRSRIWTRDDREQIQLAVRAGLELGASKFQVRRSTVWTRDNREQIQLAVRAGLELAASGLQVRRFNHSATLPPSLLPLLRSDERLKAASNLWTKNLSPIKTFPLACPRPVDNVACTWSPSLPVTSDKVCVSCDQYLGKTLFFDSAGIAAIDWWRSKDSALDFSGGTNWNPSRETNSCQIP